MPSSRVHADGDEGAPEAEAAPDAVVSPVPFQWRRRLPFLGATLDCVAIGHKVCRQQIEMLHDSIMHCKRLATDRQVAKFCLKHYNSSHMDKYEPALDIVIKHDFFYKGTCWSHGNFAARRKCSGWLSFLRPAPRTLFFFEISGTGHSREVVTCTPLALKESFYIVDDFVLCGSGMSKCISDTDAVTEPHSVLGSRSKRRSGKSETICRACQHSSRKHSSKNKT